MATTPLAGWPVPDGGVAPANSPAFAAFGAAAEKQATLVYASVSARNSAIPSPVPGMRTYITGIGQVQEYTGSVWAVTEDFTRNALTVRGTTNTVVGPAPSAGAMIFLQAGTVIVATDANGYATITFPVAFPNALITFVAMAGEAPGGARHIYQGPDISLVAMGTVGTANVRIFNDAGANVASTTSRANWFALGW